MATTSRHLSREANNQKTNSWFGMADPYFPRASALPPQSPMFWVEQKDRYLRQLAIRDIEEITKRRLVVYFANRFEQGSDIDGKDTAYMAELLGHVGKEPVDMLLETNGGQTNATEALISLIKNSVSDFRVIVANAAKSNGTLLALASRSIVMGATSELGPIDPQIQGTPCTILSKDQVAAQNFPLNQLAKNFVQQSKSLATRLLTNGMMINRRPEEISQVVEALASNDRYFSHGSVIDYQEAKFLGLSVDYLDPDNDLWKRIWLLYCMYEYDCRKARYLKLFEGNYVSTAVAIPSK